MIISIPITVMLIILLGFFAQWLAWRCQIPAILFLLLIGIIIGPVTHWFQPTKAFDAILFPFVSLSVAIILFEGALTLNGSAIRGMGKIMRRLLSIGLLASFTVVTLACYLFLKLSPLLALLIGAITVVTGPTVVAPLLRIVKPNARISEILRWEGILIDPLGAIFAVLVFQGMTIQQQTPQLSALFWLLSLMVFVAVCAGLFFANLFIYCCESLRLPHYLHHFAALALMLCSFTLANSIVDESGLLAVTIMGIFLANSKRVDLSEVMIFKEHISLILLSILFITLAARLDIQALFALGWPLLAVLFSVQFIARPICVWLATFGSDISFNERCLLSWIAPRGIVAAAMSSLFSLQLMAQHIPQANKIVSVTFAIIIFTVVFQSLTSRLVASVLKVRHAPPKRILITSANPVAQAVGLRLQKLGIPILLADADWRYYQQAVMQGLPAFYGYAYSEQAANHLDMYDIAYVLALSAQAHENELVINHFAHYINPEQLFMLSSKVDSARQKTSYRHWHRLPNMLNQYDYEFLQAALLQGSSVKATQINEQFRYSDYLKQHPEVVALLVLTEQHQIYLATPEVLQQYTNFTLITLGKSSSSKKGNVLPTGEGLPVTPSFE